MKPLLLIVFVVFGALHSRAQQYPKVDIIQPTDSLRMLLKTGAYLTPGLHHLPQDRMPCLVPEMTDLEAMPNAWSGAKDLKNAPGVISPSPGQPFRYDYRPGKKTAPREPAKKKAPSNG